MSDPTPATPTTTAKPPLPKVLARRTAIALALMALILVPSMVLFVITKQPSATYAAMGTMIGAFAVIAGGVRMGVVTSIVTALLAPIVIVAGLSPLTGAAVMALMALTVGRLAIFGLHRAVMLVPIFLAWPMLTPVPWIPTADLDRVNELLTRFGYSLAEALDQVQPGSSGGGGSSTAASSAVTSALIHQRVDTTYLTWIAVFFFVGAIVPVLILPFLLRKVHLPAPAPHPRSEAVPYTIIITVLTAVATYWFLDHPKQIAGSFFIATILVLTQVGSDIKWRITIERVLGTFGGLALLLGLTAAIGKESYTEVMGIPMPMTFYAFGVAFGVAAIIAKFSPRQWIYYILITPTAALLNAFTTSQASDVGKQRLVDNLAGATLVIVATLITIVAGRYMEKHPAAGAPSATLEEVTA